MKVTTRAVSLVLSAVLAIGGMSLSAFAADAANGEKMTPPMMGTVTAINGTEVTLSIGGGRGPGGQRGPKDSDSDTTANTTQERPERPSATDGERPEMPEAQTVTVDMSGVTIVSGGKDNQTTASLSDIAVGTMVSLTVENNTVTLVQIMPEMQRGERPEKTNNQ